MARFRYSTRGRIAGFDSLFPRTCGIERPAGKPLVVVLRGSPGSGKSTLALQLACFGEARDAKTTDDSPLLIRRNWAEGHSRCVFYYVIDDIADRIEDKIEAFGICSTAKDSKAPPPPTPPWYARQAVAEGQAPVRLGSQHSLSVGKGGRTLSMADIDLRRPKKGETVLFLVQYTGDKSFEDVKALASADVDDAAAHFDESVVVIDSIAPLKTAETAKGARPDRVSIERLFAEFTDPRISMVIIVDEDGAASHRDPYITDVLINLWQGGAAQVLPETYCERYLQIIKAATCLHVRGPQKFRILPCEGVHILPSLIASAHTLDEDIRRAPAKQGYVEGDDRISLGVDIPDIRDDEYIERGSSTTLVGPRGCFKTPIALAFCKAALKAEGKSIFFTLHEKPDTLRDFAEKLGFDEVLGSGGWGEVITSNVDADSMTHVCRYHRFLIQYVSLAFMAPEAFIAMVRRALCVIGHSREHPIRDMRIVFDSISDFRGNYPRLSGVPGFLACLLNVLAVEGVTSLFVFDGNDAISSEDGGIVGLTDNAFFFDMQAIEGTPQVLMDAKVLGSRFRGGQHIFKIEYAGLDDARPRIVAKRATAEYYTGENGRLVPAQLRLYVNRCAGKHGEFNRLVCKRFGLAPEQPYLDDELAHGSFESVLDLLGRLKVQRNYSYVVAVDLAYLRPELLQLFAPAALSNDEECGFVNISTPQGWRRHSKSQPKALDLCRDQKGELKALPTHIDCSLVLCNLNLLHRLERYGQTFRRIRALLDENRAANDKLALSLPTVDLKDIQRAAAEYQRLAKTGQAGCYFFGHREGPNPECLVGMFFDLLRTYGIGLPTQDTPERVKQKLYRILHDHSRWMSVLCDYALFCLPSEVRRQVSERKAENCIFFHTWHSLAISDGVPNGCVPVKFGTRWKGARGGWCWGAVDNGLFAKGAEVVNFATGLVMNNFLVMAGAGVPPRQDLCRETGVLSVHNLGLMRRVIETDTWSRAHIPHYPALSNYASLFFSEYVAFVKSLGTASLANRQRLKSWLECVLGEIIEKIPWK